MTGLPELYQETEHRLGAPDRTSVERVSGSRPVGIVLNDAVLDSREQILSGLASWAGLVADERSVAVPPREVGALAAFLLRNLLWLARHEAIGDLTVEIGELAAAARRAAFHRPTQRTRLGRCAHESCAEPVFATVTSTAEDAVDCVVACADGHEWPMYRWIELRGESPSPTPQKSCAARETAQNSSDAGPYTLPTPMAAAAVGVHQATVRKWASRGKLTRHGSANRPEYDIRELVVLARLTTNVEQG